MKVSQLRLECPRDNKTCWQPLFLFPSQNEPQNFKGFVKILRNGRQNFHGSPIQFKSPFWASQEKLISPGIWNEWHLAYKYSQLAKIKSLIALEVEVERLIGTDNKKELVRVLHNELRG